MIPDQRAAYLHEEPAECRTELPVIPLFGASDALKPREEIPSS